MSVVMRESVESDGRAIEHERNYRYIEYNCQ